MLKCHWHFNGICVKLSGLTINWNRSHILLTDDLSPPPSCSFYPSVCCICIGNELKQNSYLTDRSPPWWTFYLSGLHSDDALIMSNKWGTQVLYILCSMLMGCNAEGSNQQSFPAKKSDWSLEESSLGCLLVLLVQHTERVCFLEHDIRCGRVRCQATDANPTSRISFQSHLPTHHKTTHKTRGTLNMLFSTSCLTVHFYLINCQQSKYAIPLLPTCSSTQFSVSCPCPCQCSMFHVLLILRNWRSQYWKRCLLYCKNRRDASASKKAWIENIWLYWE